MDPNKRAKYQIQALDGRMGPGKKPRSSARANLTRSLAALQEAQFRTQIALARLDATIARFHGARPE